MVTCGTCGRANPDGARFCNNCGTALAAPEPRREERKVVTVLFADLVGFTSRSETMDPEDVRRLLDVYWERLRGELIRHGGTVEKFIGDAVMALFGAPTAHEDDPERAVRAALRIRDLLRAEDGEIQVRLGVNTGEALVLLGARPAEGEGMAAGDVVNTAARLQAAAPVNGVFVGETTYRATRDAIEYAERDAIFAKGKSEPLRAWEALRTRPAAAASSERARSPLIGRDLELGLIQHALDRALEGREPQLVTLVGVPGIGKSRLVAELMGRTESRPEPLIWRLGRCLPYGEGVTFWALGEMVKQQAAILETDPPERAEQRLAAAVAELLPDDPQAASIAARLRTLVGLAGGEEVAPERRAESFAAWRRFFEAIAERNALVLVFEDLHWADDGLLDFVDYLAEWVMGVPLLVIGTARPELYDRRRGWGGGKPNAVSLSLPRLSDDETGRLVDALLERSQLDPETRDELLARAGGNPLYAEQFALLLEERGTIAGLPENVQGIIAARIDALVPAEKALLQDASVVGKVFWLGAVSAIGDHDRWEVEDLLHGLVRREIVARARRSRVGGESEYAFSHVLLRDVAYHEIPRLGRARKHAAAAQWIESLGRPEDHAEMLAHHYMAALEHARGLSADIAEPARHARHALRRAGERALALGAFDAAASFYRQAIALAPPDHELHDHHLQLGRALRWAEADDRAVELERSIDALIERNDVEGAAELEALLGEVLWHANLHEDARDHLERAGRLVAELDPSPAKAAVLSQLSRFHAVAGDIEAAVAVGRPALAMAEQFELVEVQAHALNNMALAHAHAGDEDQAVADLERAVELAQAAGSAEAVRSFTDLGAMLSGLGEIRRAGELWAASRQVSEQLALRPQMRSIRGLEIFLAFVEGRWDEARPLADEFLTECEAAATHEQEVQVRMVRAQLRLAVDDRDGALGDADTAVRLARAGVDPLMLTPALTVAAVVHAELGFVDEAHSLAHEVLAHVDSGRPSGRSGVTVLLGCFADLLGVRGELREVVGRLRSPSLWVEASRRSADGDLVGAADVLEGMGAVYIAARARLAAAERLVADGRSADADVQLRRGLEVFRPIGATRFVRQAEALLPVSA